MLSGTSGSIAGLKIPCGPRKGTRTPSNSNPFSSAPRGIGESPWICFRSASIANAQSRTAASTDSTTEDVVVVPAKQLGIGVARIYGRKSNRPAVKRVVVAAILELLTDTSTDLKLIVRCDSDVTSIE